MARNAAMPRESHVKQSAKAPVDRMKDSSRELFRLSCEGMIAINLVCQRINLCRTISGDQGQGTEEA